MSDWIKEALLDGATILHDFAGGPAQASYTNLGSRGAAQRADRQISPKLTQVLSPRGPIGVDMDPAAPGYYSYTNTITVTSSFTAIWLADLHSNSGSSHEASVTDPIQGSSLSSVYYTFGYHGGKLAHRHYVGSWQLCWGATDVTNLGWHVGATTWNTATSSLRVFLNSVQDGILTTGSNQNAGSIAQLFYGYGAEKFRGACAAFIFIESLLTDARIAAYTDMLMRERVSY